MSKYFKWMEKERRKKIMQVWTDMIVSKLFIYESTILLICVIYTSKKVSSDKNWLSK